MPEYIPRPGPALAHTSMVLRRMAATDFLADPDGHSTRWHYERKDRAYAETIAWRTFEEWAINDKWVQRRVGYWEEIERRVQEHMADEFLRRRLADLEKFESRLEALDELLNPLRDPVTGIMLRDEKTHMPMFALELPSMDKFATMYLKLHERVLLLRGEATARTEQLLAKPETGDALALNEHLKEPAAIAPKFSKSDLRAMATQLLRAREPALGGTPETDPNIIDAPVEDPS